MRESSIDKRLLKALRELNIPSIKLSTLGRYGTAGWPDRLVLLPNGHVIFIELKTPRGVLSELQRRRHTELRKLGYVVCVCISAYDAIGCIEGEMRRWDAWHKR